MRHSLLIVGLLFSSFAASATTVDDVHNLLEQIHYSVDHLAPSSQDLQTIESSLRADLDLLNKRPARLLCIKSSNSRFYPSVAMTGEIIGDTDYQAGYTDFQGCKAALPAITDQVSCFKRSNSRYYPTNVQTGEIVGSTDYQAGYSTFEDCQQTLH